MDIEIKVPDEKFGMTKYGFMKLDDQKFKGFDEEDFRSFIKKEIKVRDILGIPLPEDENHWMFIYKRSLHREYSNEKAS
jgi:hypothetical protein